MDYGPKDAIRDIEILKSKIDSCLDGLNGDRSDSYQLKKAVYGEMIHTFCRKANGKDPNEERISRMQSAAPLNIRSLNIPEETTEELLGLIEESGNAGSDFHSYLEKKSGRRAERAASKVASHVLKYIE